MWKNGGKPSVPAAATTLRQPSDHIDGQTPNISQCLRIQSRPKLEHPFRSPGCSAATIRVFCEGDRDRLVGFAPITRLALRLLWSRPMTSFRGEWYAVQVRPKHERIVARLLAERGYETFLPMGRSRRRWSDRIKEIEIPLFQGYLFSRIDSRAPAPVVTVPAVIRIVGVGNLPIAIEESEIVALRTLTAARPWTEPWPFAPVGQRVRINSGPLTGVEGTVVHSTAGRRLIVSVSLLQRAVAVDIEQADVTVIPAIHRPIAAASAHVVRSAASPIA